MGYKGCVLKKTHLHYRILITWISGHAITLQADGKHWAEFLSPCPFSQLLSIFFSHLSLPPLTFHIISGFRKLGLSFEGEK